MAGKYNFKPLGIAKHTWKHSWSSDPFGQAQRGAQTSPDIEIRALGDDYDSDNVEEDEDETISSLSPSLTSASYDGLLSGTASPRRTASSYPRKMRRRTCNRYFTLALASTLVIFILTLVRLGYTSARDVAGRTFKPKPAPWEEFPFLRRYHGGIRTLVSRVENIPEYPGDEEDVLDSIRNATEASEERLGTIVPRQEHNFDVAAAHHKLPPSMPYNPLSNQSINYPPVVECFFNTKLKTRLPKLQAFPGVVRGMPDNVHGSYKLLGLRNDMCFDRFGRLGPYGLGYGQSMGGTGAGMEGDVEGAEQVWAQDPEIDFRNVKWSELQEECLKANEHRFTMATASQGQNLHSKNTRDAQSADTVLDPRRMSLGATAPNSVAKPDSVALPKSTASPNRFGSPTSPKISNSTSLKKLLPRTAVIVRTWSDYEYDPEDIMYLRALISELSLASGTEYTIHFLIHVRDNAIPIWSDEETHQRILEESLPEEFRGMGTLWSERQMALIYSGLDERERRGGPVYGNYRSTFMPMQYFAHKHPEYDFYWHWEMDVRYTGHYYELFDKTGTWAKEQPRKGLWERNARFYVPSEHGSWEDFKHMVRIQTEHGTSSKNNMFSRLGPVDPRQGRISVAKPVWGPEPPTWDDVNIENDPKPPTTYDKDKYEWGVGEEADLITFNPLFDPDQTGWGLAEDVTGYNITGGLPPRRTAIITSVRLSRRLLEAMHRETTFKHRTMFSEMWPSSCALHHGLKAVYAPHPVFIDRKWPTDYLAAIFNGGRNGASGGSRTTPFSDEREHNFLGVSWYYRTGFPADLWKRWLGYKVNNDGGEEWEMAHEGRMCLPPMLLHPVKEADLVFEHRAVD